MSQESVTQHGNVVEKNQVLANFNRWTAKISSELSQCTFEGLCNLPDKIEHFSGRTEAPIRSLAEKTAVMLEIASMLRRILLVDGRQIIHAASQM